jgi:hypothetical protein
MRTDNQLGALNYANPWLSKSRPRGVALACIGPSYLENREYWTWAELCKTQDADLRDIAARNHRTRTNADPNDTKAGRVRVMRTWFAAHTHT